MSKGKSSVQKFRYIVQFGFFAFVLALISFHYLSEQGLVTFAGPNVHAICPLGGFETAYSYITKGEYLSKIHASSLVLSGIIVLMALLVGKFFCGWLCAFGTLNDYFTKLGQKITGRKFYVPAKLDKALKPLKYVVLLVVVIFTWTLGELVFADYDPWTAFAHILGIPETFSETPWAFIILAGVLIGAFFIERFFCRYLCPLGAIQALIAKAGLVKIERDETLCIGCGACTRDCPVGIDVAKSKTIDPMECVNCLECVTDSCPKGVPAISISSFYNRKGTQVAYLVVAFLVFYGIYGTTKATGFWETSINVQKVVAEAQADGSLTTDSIKGSFEIKDVLEVYEIEKEDFYARLGLPEDFSKHKKCKDIVAYLTENGYPNASMDWVRAAVADPNFNLKEYASTYAGEVHEEKNE